MNAMLSLKLWVPGLVALSFVAVAGTAHAQALPKGYASDELPSTPATTTTAAKADAPSQEMKPTVSGEVSAAATTQISTSTDEYVDTDPSALTDFQEPLQGYGNWITDDTYGTVWVPDTTVVGADFAPYQTGGYWTLTDDDEWLWVSSYDWGYVPFHYGRWIWISGRGWSWIPGRTYAPAWVSWRVSDYGYIGWAPMAPAYYWAGGSAVYFTTVPSAAYVFCPTTYVFHTSVHTYVVHDKDTVKKVAAHSRSYKAASPTASTSGAKAPASGSASKGGAAAITRPKGPSMKDAGVPDAAVPKKRSAHDARAQLFSKKSTTAKAKTMVKSSRAAVLATSGSGAASRGASRTLATTSGQAAVAQGFVRRSGPGATSAGGGRNVGSQPPSAIARNAGASSAVPRGGSVIRTPSSAPNRASVPQRANTPQGQPRGSAVNHSRSSTSVPRAPTSSAPSTSRPSASRPSSPASAPRASAPARASTPSPSRPSAAPSRSSGSRGGRR